ncbi:MAG: putative lipid II flippase FtsW [Candidatus Paceibacterota bacterium]|jgi:cell division protein FtsW
MTKKIDKVFFFTVITLVILGVFIFISASLGVLAKNQTKFYSILFSQLVLGLCGGTLALILFSKIDYKFWRKYSFYIFLVSIAFTLLVFVPGIGFSHGGAKRWISLGFTTFQPVEFLKIGFIMYFAAWLSWVKNKVQDFKFSILPTTILLGVVALVLLKQPDTKSVILLVLVSCGMLLISGAKIRYLILTFIIAVMALGGLILFRPYLAERMKTFVDPSRDPSGSSYQLQQSLIAVGSGGMFGRGFGQSIQKYSYLPEPQGDSIFAVIGEEFGFVGSVLFIILLLVFALRGLKIANKSPDTFSRLFVAGIVILITAQSFIHIACAIGVFPLTGLPLVFVSQGGTSLLLSLAAIGIILNISKFQKR